MTLIQYSDYEFACHEKTIEEIKNHDFCGAYNWVISRVNAGIIRVYSDEEIIDTISTLYGAGSIAGYVTFLKNSCRAFSTERYEEYISSVDNLQLMMERNEFVTGLHKCDNEIGRNKSLGEVKLLILLQTLNLIHPGDVSVFCSDDRGARFGVFSLAGIHCISVITLFYHLKEWGLKKEEIEPYYISFERDLPTEQTTFKVYNKDISSRIPVPCREVFDNIFVDKYEAYGTGYLKEK